MAKCLRGKSVINQGRIPTVRQLLWATALLAVVVRIPVQGQDNDVTNARILEMTNLKLEDDVIIAKIKSSQCSFQLADKDLVELKNAGVSTKVIAAMLEANMVTVTRVFIDGKPVERHDFVDRASGDTLFLRGQHSKVIAGSTPEIILELAKDSKMANYILVQLNEKNDHRELPKKPKFNALRTTSLGESRLKVTLEGPLKPGEYVIWVIGSFDMARNVFGRGYDFTVQ
jgi:hypothetical protein